MALIEDDPVANAPITGTALPVMQEALLNSAGVATFVQNVTYEIWCPSTPSEATEDPQFTEGPEGEDSGTRWIIVS